MNGSASESEKGSTKGYHPQQSKGSGRPTREKWDWNDKVASKWKEKVNPESYAKGSSGWKTDDDTVWNLDGDSGWDEGRSQTWSGKGSSDWGPKYQHVKGKKGSKKGKGKKGQDTTAEAWQFSKEDSTARCHHCGKAGHKWADCRKRLSAEREAAYSDAGSTGDYIDHRTTDVRRRRNYNYDPDEEKDLPTQHLSSQSWTGPTLQEIQATPHSGSLPTAYEHQVWLEHLEKEKQKKEQDEDWARHIKKLDDERDARVAKEDRDAKIVKQREADEKVRRDHQQQKEDEQRRIRESVVDTSLKKVEEDLDEWRVGFEKERKLKQDQTCKPLPEPRVSETPKAVTFNEAANEECEGSWHEKWTEAGDIRDARTPEPPSYPPPGLPPHAVLGSQPDHRKLLHS